MKKKHTPNTVDAIVGRRVRQRRLALQLSQEDFGKQIGVTFQQVQKYELGKNRIAVSRLIAISEALACEPNDLLDGLHNGQIIDVDALSDDAMKFARRFDELPDALQLVVVATLRAAEAVPE